MDNNTVLKDYMHSKGFKKALCVIGVLIIALIIFQAGMFVGYRRAAFSYRFGDNYHQMFGVHRGEFSDRNRMGMFGGEFSNTHGAIGRIISITLPTMMIEDRDGVEKVILLGSGTDIRRFRDAVKAEELKMGDTVVVMGSPNEDAQIDAKLIRLMPDSFDGHIMSTGTPMKLK